MRELRKLTERQKQILIEMQSSVPGEVSLDDIMALGSRRFIEFSKSKGIKLTKRGEKALEHIERE